VVTARNGTVALSLALKIMREGLSEEAIVPDFTFIATANAVILAEGRPVFLGVREPSPGMD
jgi:dTDP-4-amino-4,6-dideoxygalactose transaminase